jgi:hypothetical protein
MRRNAALHKKNNERVMLSRNCTDGIAPGVDSGAMDLSALTGIGWVTAD